MSRPAALVLTGDLGMGRHMVSQVVAGGLEARGWRHGPGGHGQAAAVQVGASPTMARRPAAVALCTDVMKRRLREGVEFVSFLRKRHQPA
jgi:hypothetical protein